MTFFLYVDTLTIILSLLIFCIDCFLSAPIKIGEDVDLRTKITHMKLTMQLIRLKNATKKSIFALYGKMKSRP